jgi:hypothetical protein
VLAAEAEFTARAKGKELAARDFLLGIVSWFNFRSSPLMSWPANCT